MHAKYQSQGSTGSKDIEWKQMDGRTRPTVMVSLPTRSVKILFYLANAV